MKVNFYATLRQIVGQRTIEVALPEGATAKDLVGCIVEQYPKMRPELLDEDGQLHGHLHLFINGRDAPYLENALDTILDPGDKIDIFPAVGGG